MPDGGHDAERCTDEGAGHLGDQFFAGIGFRAERTGMFAIETGLMAGPMAKFMEGRAVPVDRLGGGTCTKSPDGL
jgi:hypothetical protein